MQHEDSGINERDSKDTDHEQQAAKGRKRVSRACNRCRAKKDRCDGRRPSCTPCATAHLDCSYEQATKKRGLPEGYVRGLEKLWALSIGKIGGLEDAVSEITEQHHQELLELWNHEITGEDLHTIWKESKVLSELEFLLSGLERDTPTGSKRKREKDDEGDDSESLPSSLHRQIQYQVAAHNDQNQTSQGGELLRSRSLTSLETPSLPEGASRLLDHYFTHTHCWFPILARPQILKVFYGHSRQQAAGQDPNSDIAVLWAIFAYTTALNRDPNDPHPEKAPGDRITRAKQIREIARSLIPNDFKNLALGHVQALLLLSLLDIGLGEWCSGWILIGIAVRAALSLRLQSNITEKRGTSALQGCFILDTLVASHLEQPPHLRRSDMKSVGYLDEDGHEEWEPWNPTQGGVIGQQDPAFIISCFNRLFDVFLIQNDVISLISSDEKARRSYFAECAEEMDALQGRFPIITSPAADLPPHQMYLRMFHHSTHISVLRQAFAPEPPLSSLANLASNILALVTGCVEKSALYFSEIPSVLEHPVRSACYAAIAAKPEFGGSPGSLSYNGFARQMTDHILRISPTWAAFSSMSRLWETALRPAKQSHNGFLSSPDTSKNHKAGQDTFPFLQPGTFEKSFPPLEWSSATIHSQDLSQIPLDSPIPATEADHRRNWSTLGATTVSLPSTDLTTALGEEHILASNPSGSHPGGDPTGASRHESLDMAMSGLDQFSPAGLAMPAVEASPSFHGDDVDTIFHNLVHLDTTEWTTSRSQGLRDFGFADDMTFQAFCNDPERLVAPGAPFGQTEAGNSGFWPSASLQNFPSAQRYQDEDERVGWWG